jgi:DNA-binding NarL/FixJ family response regulator
MRSLGLVNVGSPQEQTIALDVDPVHGHVAPMTRNPLLGANHQVSSPAKVAVVTLDHKLTAALTTHAPDVEWVDAAASEVVIVDLVMAGLPATFAAYGVPVIALVVDAKDVAAMVQRGARGVLLRSQCADGIAAAIAAVRHGLTVMDMDFASPVDASPQSTALPKRGKLTEREYQVVQLLAEGLSNKLIADRLKISDHTAKFHVNGVMAKLSASTRTEAVVIAMRLGVVPV